MGTLARLADPPSTEGVFNVGRLLLVGVLAITILRLAAPLQIGKDQAQQIEAGYRLVAGLGITSTNSAQPTVPDITPDPEPHKLTLWPPGLSITIGGLLLCGVPALVTLKLLGASLTLAGWLGWSRLYGKLLPAGFFSASPPMRVIFLLTSFLLPFFYTPLWSGTDIFLWAAVPWTTLLLTPPPDSPRPVLAAVTAGVLVGLSFWFRYAGAFLGLAGILILSYRLWPNWQALLVRSVVFGGVTTLLALPVVIFMRSGYVPLSDVYDAGLETGEVHRILSMTYHTVRLIFGNPLPEMMLARWNWQPALYATGLFSITAILAAPVIAALRMANKSSKSMVVSLLILPAALVLFLSVVSRGFFLGVSRYYEPVQLCWILAVLPFLGESGAAARGAKLLTAAFCISLLFVTPLRSLNASGQAGASRTVLGYTPSRTEGLNSTSAPVSFPEPGRLFTIRSATRDKILELHRAHPDALLWAENYPMYVYDTWRDGPKPGSTLRPLPSLPYLLSAHSSRDRKIFVVLEDAGAADFSTIQWPGQTVYRNSWEKTEIREINLASGQPVLGLASRTPAAVSTEAQ